MHDIASKYWIHARVVRQSNTTNVGNLEGAGSKAEKMRCRIQQWRNGPKRQGVCCSGTPRRTSSHIPSPSPGPYESISKAKCQKHIEYVDHQIRVDKAAIARRQVALDAAAQGSTPYRTVKNNLDNFKGSRDGWEECKRITRR